jgi:hypothetical protein
MAKEMFPGKAILSMPCASAEVDNSGTNPAEHWMLNLLADVYINLTLAEQPDDGCAGQ